VKPSAAALQTTLQQWGYGQIASPVAEQVGVERRQKPHVGRHGTWFQPEMLFAREARTSLDHDPGESADAALAAFGLAERARHRAGALSGGEQQRVAIAAAAGRRAPLVLADEPTGELDASNERIVLESLRDLRDTFGSTVVVVTHSSRVAGAADRVVEMRDGKVLA